MIQPELKVLLDENGFPTGLQCPHCEAKITELIEVDQATRWNRAQPEFDDGVLVLAYGRGQADFEHYGYLCDNCTRDVALPEDFNDDLQGTLSETWE